MAAEAIAHDIGMALVAAIALLWVIQSVRMIAGMAALPQMASVRGLPPDCCPLVSVLVAARDEAEHLRAALLSQIAQDCPRLEVVVIDDRSRDATPQILDELAQQHSNLKVIRVDQLPAGWLGKAHALFAGYLEARGDWLVFTDADVQFAPDLLRRALALAEERQWDHLTVFPQLEAVGFWEKTLVSYFAMAFVLAFEPWRVSDPRSSRYLGVGAFQLLRRSAYEAIGTHRRLALEIADDTKLGKLVKQHGFRSGVALGDAGGMLRVRWQVGLGNLVRGLEKNFFAACGYRASGVAEKLLLILAFSEVPFIALGLGAGLTRSLAAVSALAALVAHGWAARRLRALPLVALTQPLGGLILCYAALRSTASALRRRGVVWRGTFYPLEELRRGMV